MASPLWSITANVFIFLASTTAASRVTVSATDQGRTFVTTPSTSVRPCPCKPSGARVALTRRINEPSSWESLFAFWDLLPEQHCYAADTLWSNDDFASALPRLAEHINGAPSANSLMLA